jgi:nucleotide sugar dehydrogenase
LKKNIGIIGKGFVGSAVAHGFSSACGYDGVIRVYDSNPMLSTHSLDETINESNFLFISVPTPSNTNGSVNLDILYNCINDIQCNLNGNNPVILIRSTVVPGTTQALSDKFPDLNIVFNPEFLTERSANFDFINQARFVLGGDSSSTNVVAELFRDRFGSQIPIIETTYETAELIKYMCNTYFATKISFLNEMKLIADQVNVNWDDAMNGFLSDGRIGHSHTNIPGHDGKKGFGGSCFPKDVQAIIHYAKSLNIDLGTLEGAWKTNVKIRPEKDWEMLKGRSVT